MDKLVMSDKEMPDYRSSIVAEQVRIQRFTKHSVNGTDSGMVKECSVSGDGNLIKDSSQCWMSHGEVKTVEVAISEFGDVLTSCGRDQALCFSNIHLDGIQPIASMKHAKEGELTRTLDNFGWDHGPAALLFDADAFNGDIEAAIESIDTFCPGFKDAAKVYAPSTADGIFNTETGNPVSGTTSFHLILFVHDASVLPDPKTMRDRFLQKAWLAGYGHIFITKDGKMLPRCVVDVAVFSPERLIFRGEPALAPPLAKEPCVARYFDGTWLDTTVFTEPLTAVETARYEQFVSQVKSEKKDEADSIRNRYKQENIQKLVESGRSPTEARNIVDSRLGDILIGNDLLYFDDTKGPATVAEVLNDPLSFNEMTLSDPIEPDYGGAPGVPTKNKAILYYNVVTNRTTIFSQAHGGLLYALKYDRDTAIQVLQNKKSSGLSNTEIVDYWKEMRPHVQADKADLDQIYAWFKAEKITTIGALRELESSQNDTTIDDPGLYVTEKVLNDKYAGGQTLKHTSDGSFWAYTGTHWRRITDDAVRESLVADAKALSEMTGGKFKTAQTISSAFTIIGAQQACNSGMMALDDQNPAPVINLANGELWLTEDGPELRPHSPDTNALYVGDVAYDASALCPHYDAFMELVFRGQDCEEVIMHFEEIMGYIIQPSRWLKLNVMMYGDGYNAKTPLAELPQRILGTEVVAPIDVAKLDADRWATSSLAGKLIALDDDLKYGSTWPDSQMKKLSEQKLIDAEFKGKDKFRLINRAIPIVLTNTIPYFRDTTLAIKERLQVIHFPHSFKDPKGNPPDDPYTRTNATRLLGAVFEHELPGVLNRLIAGYYRLRERGHLDPPKACLIAKESVLKEGNTLLWFLDSEYEPNPTADSMLLVTLHNNYADWCTDAKVRNNAILTERTFAARVRDAGYEVKESHGQVKVFGIQRKQPGGRSVAA
jgi:P4 family phage/plasmid primase-like protien